MAKRGKGPGWLKYLFFSAVIASLAIFLLLSNTFNFKTFLSYGPSQYFANILHFHYDYYCQSKSNLRIYDKILPADSPGEKVKKRGIVTLPPGKRFKLMGYRAKDYVTWVAAKVAYGSDMIYGYFMIPEKIEIPTFSAAVNRLQERVLESEPEPFTNKYFKEIPRKSTLQYRDQVARTFKRKLEQSVSLKKASNPIEMQRIKESSDFEIIPYISSDKTAYYCPKNEYKKVKVLYNGYLGDGFDIHYLQAGGGYLPGKSGIFEEGLLIRVVDSWYFKIFVALILFWLFKRLRKGPKPNSNSGDPDIDERVSRQEIQAQHEGVSMRLTPEMSVVTLKERFKEAFGFEIRVYTTIHTKRLADDAVPLSSLRDVKGSLGALSIEPSARVSQIEKLFEELGIGIQVMKSDGSGLASDNAKLSNA